ncbi:hypothetical protein [Bacteroides faecis]|nr:hypothetical protein [Bacteroides faecis]MCS2936561.1 hypothetical protein [Bacteroides faecis]MCY6311273.1 hypothetical protein [Bacteroides faecis]UVR67998.1 hypothetical protein NXW26_18640 [Bacteroides faecis]UVS51196.1 hypothetical protein NXW99_17595 [Bacteroides faecis]
MASPSSHVLLNWLSVVTRVCGRFAPAVAAGVAKPISKRMSPPGDSLVPG